MYEIRLEGLVPSGELERELGDVEVVEHEFRTVLSGSFPDQAALYAFLHRLRSLGLEVVEVRRVPAAESAPEAVPDPPPASVVEPVPDEPEAR